LRIIFDLNTALLPLLYQAYRQVYSYKTLTELQYRWPPWW